MTNDDADDALAELRRDAEERRQYRAAMRELTQLLQAVQPQVRAWQAQRALRERNERAMLESMWSRREWAKTPTTNEKG
jgi:hypothetical protein